MTDIPRPLDQSPLGSVRISPASPLDIRCWSYGGIKTVKLFDSEQSTFHEEGLFSDRIFGPLRPEGDRPGRFQRYGHLELSVPVLHPWFSGHDDAPLELLLGLSHAEVQRIVNYQTRVVIDRSVRQPTFERVELTESEQFQAALNFDLSNETGAIAIGEMLALLDYAALYETLKERLAHTDRQLAFAERHRLTERIKLVRAVVEKRLVPVGFVIEALPVLPAGFRWLALTPDGKVKTDWLTAAYRRIVRDLAGHRAAVDAFGETPPQLSLGLHEVRLWERIVRGEVAWLMKKLLSRGSPIRGSRRRESMSRLTWGLSGKAICWPIVPDPSLRFHECGLPTVEFIKQFYPLKSGTDTGSATGMRPVLPPVLCGFVPAVGPDDLSVLYPRWSEERAIRVHPLVISAAGRNRTDSLYRFHMLRTPWTQRDGDALSPSGNRLPKPTSRGRLPLELTVGCTRASQQPTNFRTVRDEWMKLACDFWQDHPVFRDLNEVVSAWERGLIKLHQIIAVNLPPTRRPPAGNPNLFANRRWCTTTGRALLNAMLPDEMPISDEVFSEPVILNLLEQIRTQIGPMRSAKLAEDLMEFACQTLTQGGCSFSMSDLGLPEGLARLQEQTDRDLQRALKTYDRGLITSTELYYKKVDIIQALVHNADQALGKHLELLEASESLLLPLCEGGGISFKAVQALSGVIGYIVGPRPACTQSPVRSNFHSGLRIQDYFWKAASARKETIIRQRQQRTAHALRQKLIQLMRNLVVTEHDCGTHAGVEIRRWKLPDKELPTAYLARTFRGRTSLETIRSPVDGSLLISIGECITAEIAEQLAAAGVVRMKVRHPLTCEARSGVCSRCYGAAQPAEVGATVGIQAAFQAGEVLDELPLKSLQTTTTREYPSESAVTESSGVVSLKGMQLTIDEEGTRIALSSIGTIELLSETGSPIERYDVPHGAIIPVAAGDRVHAGKELAYWNFGHRRIYSRRDGRVRITPNSSEPCWSMLDVLDDSGSAVDGCLLPPESTIHVRHGQTVGPGTLLANVPYAEPLRERVPTQDLLEVRRILQLRPCRRSAVLAKADGRVVLKLDDHTQICEIQIHPSRGEPVSHFAAVAATPRILIRTGDVVCAGDRLTDGKIDHHDQNRLWGPLPVFDRILDDLRPCIEQIAVARRIGERPWELIVAQLLRWVTICAPGDSQLETGQELPRNRVMAINNQLRTQVTIPPDSFFSLNLPIGTITPAEFQELKQEWSKRDPKLPLLKSEQAWPAGWTPTMLGLPAAVERSTSALTSGGVSPTQSALVRAALEGRLEEFSGVMDAELMDHPIHAGTALETMMEPHEE